MRRKRGRFTTFMWSLIPGAAEMYMGFMKKGISLMTIFILSFVIPSVLRLSDAFILFAVLIWFYSYFHARNLASCSEEEFRVIIDEYVWSSMIKGKEIQITNPALQRWGAIALIVYGVVRLWDVFASWVYYWIPDHMWEAASMIVNEVPQVLIAVVIIIVGLKLIVGKKEEMNGEGK